MGAKILVEVTPMLTLNEEHSFDAPTFSAELAARNRHKSKPLVRPLLRFIMTDSKENF